MTDNEPKPDPGVDGTVQKPGGRSGGVDPALGRLVHEIRTPLAAIQSMAEAMAQGQLGPVGSARHIGYLRHIEETARHALAVVADITGQADGRRAATRPVDLSAVALEIAGQMTLLAARAGVRIVAHSDLFAPPVLALARVTDVRQMLINLVANGISHAGGGATISIKAGGVHDRVWLDVSDDGPGYPPDVLTTLATGGLLDPAVGASGAGRLRLGLTLTQGIAVANGGRLELGSNSGGARARLLLPAARASGEVALPGV